MSTASLQAGVSVTELEALLSNSLLLQLKSARMLHAALQMQMHLSHTGFGVHAVHQCGNSVCLLDPTPTISKRRIS